MRSRQTLPRQWLIVDAEPAAGTWRSLRRLPQGGGIIVVGDLSTATHRRLLRLASSRRLTLADETIGDAARVHHVRELRRALLRRTPLVLVSPIFPTESHPDWRPLPRMRAAALAQLGKRRLFALGGMNARRYARIAPLGFVGWAGISAFRT